MKRSPQRFVILGGGGFIGQNLCKYLLNQKKTVICITRTGNGLTDFSKNNNFTSIKGKVENSIFLSSIFQSGDIVFDLANGFKPLTAEKNSGFYLENSINSILSIAGAAKNKGIAKLVYISSGGTVYGEVENRGAKEEDHLLPKSAYGIGKVLSEKTLIKALNETNIKYVIARPSNPYGAQNLNNHGIIDVIFHHLSYQKPLNIWTSFSSSRDFIHITDLSYCLALLGTKKTAYKIYNIGSEDVYTIKDLVILIEALLKKKLIINLKKRKTFEVSNSSLDCTRFKNEFSWLPSYSVASYLKEKIRFLKLKL